VAKLDTRGESIPVFAEACDAPSQTLIRRAVSNAIDLVHSMNIAQLPRRRSLSKIRTVGSCFCSKNLWILMLIILSGLPGAGKTAISVELARQHRCRARPHRLN
jgi:hypothetical protein